MMEAALAGAAGSGTVWAMDRLDPWGTANMARRHYNLAREDREITRQREDTAIQRKMADMKAAGVNPMAAFFGGMGQGAQASQPPAHAGGQEAAGKRLQAMMMGASKLSEISKTLAETDFIRENQGIIKRNADVAERNAAVAERNAAVNEAQQIVYRDRAAVQNILDRARAEEYNFKESTQELRRRGIQEEVAQQIIQTALDRRDYNLYQIFHMLRQGEQRGGFAAVSERAGQTAGHGINSGQAGNRIRTFVDNAIDDINLFFGINRGSRSQQRQRR